MTYLEFAVVEAAAAGVAVLRARGDGGDPDEPCNGGCKALVSGWVANEGTEHLATVRLPRDGASPPLIVVQDWARACGRRLVCVFERDAS